MSLKLSSQSINYIETHKIQRILVIKLTSLGDVIHALPVAAGLKKTFPYVKLFWVVEDRCAPLLENHPLLDSVVIYPRQRLQAFISGRKWIQALILLRDLRRTLRALHIDLSLDLQGLAKSGLMALLAGAPHRIGCFGLKEISGWISQSLPHGADLHAIDRNLQVAHFLGVPVDYPEFIFGIEEEEKTWARRFLDQWGLTTNQGLIGLQVGASFPQKCWPLPKIVSFIQKISLSSSIRVILFGDQTDRERLGPFRSQLSPQVINTLGELSLRRLLVLINECRLFVGADTGPLHLAAGLGVPVIGLYGADDPRWTGAYGPLHRIHYKRFPCSPCNKNPVCQGRFDCMEAIEVDEVLESFKALLGNAVLPRGTERVEDQ